jgi:apolipoprotein N-acyltransferase
MLLLFPVLTGFLLAMSFPRFSQYYLAWIAFVPLIVFVFRVKTPGRAFWGGYIAGGIELFTLLLWMPVVLERYGGLSAGLAWTGYALLVLLLSCFSGIACLVTKVFMRRGGDSFLFLFPAVWILIEYIQTIIPFGGFPWLTVGYSQTDWLRLIQISDLTGVYGVSFLVLWFGTAVSWIVLNKGRNFRIYRPMITAAAIVCLCLLYGRISMGRWDTLEPDFKAVMLQGNLSPDETATVLEDKYQGGYVRMADSLKSSDVDLLILPESPTPIIYQWDERYREMLEGLARRYRYGMIFNNIRSEGTGEDLHYFNSAYFLDGKGASIGVYDKMHLVPFGEYIPLKNLLVFIRTITQDVGEFHPGRDYKVFKLGEYPVNATICFEAIFPDLVRRFVRNGSRLLVNLTNDGWYGDSNAPFQHFSIARWRAVENRRYFLRAANSGISAVIEPTGRIQTETGILSPAVCEGRFTFIAQQTFYTRYGDVFVFLCAIITLGSMIFIYMRNRKKRLVNSR